MRRSRMARAPRRSVKFSVALGLVTGLLMLGVLGAGVYLTQPPVSWISQVSLLVRPSVSQDDQSAAGYYENLSSGQVVQTFAEILRSRLPGDTGQSAGGDVVVQVVPGTFLIRVAVTTSTREQAVSAGTRLGQESVAAIDVLNQPYELRIVGAAADNVEETGGLNPPLLGVAALLALLAGAGIQQLVWWWQRPTPVEVSAEEPDDHGEGDVSQATASDAAGPSTSSERPSP